MVAPKKQKNMNIELYDIHSISIKDRKLNRTQSSKIKMSKDILLNGLINPITIQVIDEQPILIAGEVRLGGAILAGMKKIPCVVIDSKTEDERILIECSENLIRENLSSIEKAKLLYHNKTAYEKVHSNSTKASKSKNNPKKGKKDTPTKSFVDVASEDMKCTPKQVSELIRRYAKINDYSSEFADDLLNMNNKLKIKGVELKSIADMKNEDMVKFAAILKENKNKDFSISDYLHDEKVLMTKKEKDHLIFLLDLENFANEHSEYEMLNSIQDFDRDLAKSVKSKSRLDFTDIIQTVLSKLSLKK